jgi:hypothetical protein
MGETGAFLILFIAALIGANLPWFSERLLFLLPPPGGEKKEWMRLLEWFLMYWIVGGLAVGLEYRMTGDVYSQDWEFYVTTLCLFVVFALPGFIYHHDLRKYLWKRR